MKGALIAALVAAIVGAGSGVAGTLSAVDRGQNREIVRLHVADNGLQLQIDRLRCRVRYASPAKRDDCLTYVNDAAAYEEMP